MSAVSSHKTNRQRQRRDLARRSFLSRKPQLESLEGRALMATLDTFLTTEHVDLNIASTSPWTVGPLEGGQGGTQYNAENALLYVGQQAETERPGGANYNFIGVAAGADFYELPAAQNSDVLYTGISGYGVPTTIDRYSPATESKGRITGTGRWSKLTLADVKHYDASGNLSDGVFSLYEYGPTAPKVFMSNLQDNVSNPDANGLDTTDGISSDDALWVLAGSHNHYNFGFSKPGRYEVDLVASAYLTDDGVATPNIASFSQSAPIRLYFSVLNVGQIEFDAASYTVNEAAGTATINVRRTGGTDGRITAQYATTTGGTATVSSDYAAATGTVTFEDLETIKTITVPIVNDTLDEPNETVNLTLSNPGPATIADYVVNPIYDNRSLLGTQSTAVLTIVDNDDPANTLPTISDVANQTTSEDTATGAITFTVGDLETAAASLVVSATSSNTTLVPNANIVLGGSGANRTVTLTPAANQSGTTTITLTVADGSGATTTDTFVLTVGAVNDAPTISDVANQTTNANTATGALAVTVGDVETAVNALVVTATSSNTTLVPNANIVVGGSGANRTVTITPATGQSGTTTITLTVTDASGSTATDTFVLTVNPPNGAPTISAIADSFVTEDTSTSAIAFTVGDDVTPAGSLVVTATSSNTTIVPNANIVFGGSEANRTVTVTPAAGRYGPTTITLTVTDGNGAQTSDTFVLTVTANSLVPFGVPASFSVSSDNGSSSLVSADFNGDGKIDVVSVGSFPGSLVLLKGNGDGTFQAGVPVDGGSPYFARTPFAVDYDGDGDVDLLTREFDAPPAGIETEGQVAVHLNDGAGNFTRQVLVGGLTLGASAIQVGELNGDGRPDFIRWANSTTLVYHESLPGGGYAPPEVVSSSFTSLNATRFQLEDIDADGDLDILAYDTTPRRLSIFRNDGAGNFGAPQQLTFAASTTVRAVADITGDGRPDILATDTATVYYAQNSDGTFGARTVLSTIGSGVTRMIPTDLNQDGVVDLVIIQSNAPRWAAGRGNGAFGATQVLWASAGVQAIIAPDLDGDGDQDIAVGTSTTDTAVTVLENLTGENPMRLIPPEARTYLGGDQINLQVHFGFPITVTGTPRLALQLGANTVYANYVSGAGTPTLTFRYTVVATDVDLDGLQLACPFREPRL